MKLRISVVLSLALLLALSGTAMAKAAKPKAPAKPWAPPANFAALATLGAQWSFKGEYKSVSVDFDADDNRIEDIDEKGFSTDCRITEVKTFKKALASKLVCGDHPGKDTFTVEGSYVVNSAGLYMVESMPATEAELAKAIRKPVLFMPLVSKKAKFPKTCWAAVTPDYQARLSDGRTIDGWCGTCGGNLCDYAECNEPTILRCFSDGIGPSGGLTYTNDPSLDIQVTMKVVTAPAPVPTPDPAAQSAPEAAPEPSPAPTAPAPVQN